MALVLFNSIVAGYPIPGLGLLLGFACRQGKGEAAPFAHLAFGLDLAAGQVDQHLADMQPSPVFSMVTRTMSFSCWISNLMTPSGGVNLMALSTML